MSDPRSTIVPLKSFTQVSPPDAAKALAIFVMLVATLYFGKEVLVPITLALLLAFILAPLVDFLTRLRFGRVPSVLLGVVFALGVIVAIGSVIGTQIADLTTDLPQYTKTIQGKVAVAKKYSVDKLSNWADELGPHAGKDQPGPNTAAPPQNQTSQQSQPTPVAPPQPEASPLTLAEHYLATVLSPLATFGIVFVVAVFALLQREDLRNRLIRLIGSDDLHHTTAAIDDAGRRLSRYFVAQLTINTVFSIVIGVGLLIIGVPNPVLWAIVSGLLRFVPYVGSIISAVFPLALAAAVEPGWSMLIWTAALYGIVEPVTGQFIEPMIYGNSTGLSPFSVIVAAIFWSWLWGPVGLLLSTPLTLCLVVIGRHAKRLEFLDVVLGDRPPLTPVETFYQRILAGDPDEAQDHAELLLKEISLSTYYDEIALKGLRRAAEDSRRSAIDHDRLDCVNKAIATLVAGLDQHVDAQPITKNAAVWAVDDDQQDVRHNPDPHSISPTTDELTEAWRHQPAVLCVAGRAPLDEAATGMLVQLLGKHGMNARLVRYDEVSREHIMAFDASSAAMACVCSLDLDSSPASVRYLIQRLRQRLPQGTPIAVGLSSGDGPASKDDGFRRQIGADLMTRSLEQTVSVCADIAQKAAHLAASASDTAARV